MAERERYHVTRRAVAVGFLRAVAGYGVAFAFGVLLRYTAAPVLRDFNWLDRVPGFGTIGLLSAPLALVVWLVSVRSGRSVVPEGAAAELPRGTRALAIARAQRGGSGDPRGGSGVEKSLPIQRWDRALLAGDDRLPGQEGVTS